MGGVVLLCNTAKLRKNYVTFLETDNKFYIVLHSFINVCLKVKYRTGGKAILNKMCTLYCSWIARDNVRIRNINFCAEIKSYMAFFETYWESYTFIIYKDNINVLTVFFVITQLFLKKFIQLRNIKIKVLTQGTCHKKFRSIK